MTSTGKRINLNKVLTPMSDGDVKRRLEALTTKLESGQFPSTSRIADLKKRFPEKFKTMAPLKSPVEIQPLSNLAKEKPAVSMTKPVRYLRTAKPRNAITKGKAHSAKLDR